MSAEQGDQEYCPQCATPTDSFRDGYCEDCAEENQRRLDEHNAGYDWWSELSDRERAEQIKRAYK